MDLVLARLFFVALLSGVCYFLHPFGATGWVGAVGGAVAAGSVIVFELRVRALSLRRLIGAVVGSVDKDMHQVSNLQAGDADLVTLHVYSPPLLVMGTYSLHDRERGEEQMYLAFTDAAGI